MCEVSFQAVIDQRAENHKKVLLCHKDIKAYEGLWKNPPTPSEYFMPFIDRNTLIADLVVDLGSRGVNSDYITGFHIHQRPED